MPTICKVADFSYSNFIECVQKTKLQSNTQVVIPSDCDVVLYSDKCYQRLYDFSGTVTINPTEVVNEDQETAYTDCKLFFVDNRKYSNEFKCALNNADSTSMLFDVITFVYTISVFNSITFVAQLNKIRPNYSRAFLFEVVNHTIQQLVDEYCKKNQIQQIDSQADKKLLLSQINNKLENICCTEFGILLDILDVK